MNRDLEKLIAYGNQKHDFSDDEVYEHLESIVNLAVIELMAFVPGDVLPLVRLIAMGIMRYAYHCGIERGKKAIVMQAFLGAENEQRTD